VPPKGDTSSLVKNADTSWTITERDGLKRNFDPAGKLTSIIDRFGNILTFSYDSGKLTAVSDGNGRSITFGYKADGKLETVTDPKGSNSFIFTYTSEFPSGNSGCETISFQFGNEGFFVLARNFCLQKLTAKAAQRASPPGESKSRGCAEAYTGTLYKQAHGLTQPGRKRTVSG
jgi:YD repeat-containing protein